MGVHSDAVTRAMDEVLAESGVVDDGTSRSIHVLARRAHSGGTHPGSGLPVIYSSARITTELLLGDLGVDAGTILPRRPEAIDPADAVVRSRGGKGAGRAPAGAAY